jgi:hypothetical protein
MIKKIGVEEGSGNVFADIGLPNPEERLAKADLAIRISEAIRSRRGQTPEFRPQKLGQVTETQSSPTNLARREPHGEQVANHLEVQPAAVERQSAKIG